MRIVVLGGTGNFGARIVRALAGDPGIELVATARRVIPVPGAASVPVVPLEVAAQGLGARLASLSPALVIHCAGPFQGQDYRVARATLAAGAHYIDLADSRAFVAGFAAALDAAALAAGRAALVGASTLPALSSAVVARLADGLTSLETIESVIAPGQLAPRGAATLAAVFSYLGRDFRVWRDGAWRRTWGWMDLRRVSLDVGPRLAAACDVPDLDLLPARYPGVRTVAFHAALEIRAQHLGLWLLAGLRRACPFLPTNRWAIGLDRIAGWFDRWAGPAGGMAVSVVGRDAHGRRVRRGWQLVAPVLQGPEVPGLAATILARRLAAGERPTPGARPCVELVSLAAFEPEFARWGMRTRMLETDA
jgi:hypothetical protein